ncbi:MAG TPA: hypothetical protein VHL54_00030, partial [Actinomycetota bacterium]|nr:hypothetical protein [Actinomycetota bacterium]
LAGGGGFRLGRGRAAGGPEPPAEPEPGSTDYQLSGGYRFSALDLLVPAAIFLVVFVPDARSLAGRSFLQESLLHWDFYAMGPALAFSHGRALATDAYAMYGLGWPALFGGLAGWMPLSFARMMQIGSLYACLYFAGFYLLLRLLVRRPGLAALGTGVAMLQLFLGFHSEVIWMAPSITVMRWPFDVWCLVALVLYSRTGGRPWALAAGLAIGLGIVFSTDTGLYLGAAAGLWWLATLWASPDRPGVMVDGLVAGAAGLAVLVAGLAVASRGTLFSEAFLRGWVEPLADYRGGFAQLPLSTFPNRATVALFAALFLGYLATLIWALARITAREAGVAETFFASVSVYGLLTLLHFVGRSYDHTPLRLLIPMVLLGAVAAGRALDRYDAGPDGSARRHRVGRFGPLAVAGVGVVAALLLPHRWLVDPVAAYPSALRSAAVGTPDRRLCLLTDPDDICGLLAAMGPAVERVNAIAARLREADRAGRTVAVVDESGSLWYLAAGVAPAHRNPRMFIDIYREQKLRDTLEALRRDPPEVVLTRRALSPDDPALSAWPPGSFGLGPSPGSLYPDTWEAMTRFLGDRYRLEETLDPFEIWTLRES